MPRKLVTEIEGTRVDWGTIHWWEFRHPESMWHFELDTFGKIAPQIPDTAKKVWAVVTKRKGRHGYSFHPDGAVEGLKRTVCSDWHRIIERLYKAGYRAVQFEYV